MPDEAILREQARAAVQHGRLPARSPDRTWGGPGVGANCAVCEQSVTKDEMEFEIEFSRGADFPGLDTFHVHIRCFAAWEFERKWAQETARITQTGAVRCVICGHGIRKPADLVTKGADVMHLGCDKAFTRYRVPWSSM